MINKELLKTESEKLGLTLDEMALERFDKYAELLVYWNERINLTAITEPDDIVLKHFIDSLAFLKYRSPEKGASLIDVGTGAGFPGLALKIARPDLNITLMDSTQKKLGVIEEILKEIGLTANVVHARAEEAGHNKAFREQYDFSTARAVSNLRDLSEYCLPFVKVDGKFISLKGADAKNELEEATVAIKTLGGNVEKIDIFELSGCGERAIIQIQKVSETLDKYPRPKGKMIKQPL